MIFNTLPSGSYLHQLAEKVACLKSMMAPFQAPEAEIFSSPAKYYRMRAEFRVWHDGDQLYHIMFVPGTKQHIRIEQFPAASQLINLLMRALIAAIKDKPVLRYKLFQIDYLSTRSNKIIASLLYHRPLDEEWQQHASILRDQLRSQGFDLHLIGRAAKTKILLDQDYVDEILPVAGRDIIYRQVENSFTQPNAAVNIHMLQWVIEITKNVQGDLLELYCGNGNFSLALARNFDRILATEIAKPSVAAAQFNIVANNVDNVKIIRMSAEELIQALQGVRKFNRLQSIALNSYRCETIFVDPPRSGLDNNMLDMVRAYPRILYISCNPITLCANLGQLKYSHKIKRLALFDQFPYSCHMECGVLLEKYV
ncbi:tRNA (uridine(54)-C5)-methyltransferase TrmA [Candidatus Fukatsuia symbiotica]|uniref:tRNA/tmRNA (uracil-C(5))-methyltransferase n=1 Tax=Candidatus Fukatsuia symbiotica TaxID=1878942 RepID=A0A2U8I736_9GAMM|nr:tRNA (uridine(54)-C5)-methyltransferase TrmA [Candidatus Fukatsuia symbiotica]AWK14923.1 tRNA (uridine(54)-C5)-methyltransferase TrmA [Candidatus Fukatsuia symbiotica]MEA9445278.1 tRNA (uridine(54)-C5)-methyltransferase TrmA [Candidatus Fukatsuia symbiotica]